MFTEENVNALLYEERQEYYPYSPLIIDAHHGIFYLNIESIIIHIVYLKSELNQ